MQNLKKNNQSHSILLPNAKKLKLEAKSLFIKVVEVVFSIKCTLKKIKMKQLVCRIFFVFGNTGGFL